MSTYHYEQKDSERRGSGIFSNQLLKEVKEGFYKIPVLKIKNRCNYEKLKHYLKQSSKRIETEKLAKSDLILKYRNEVASHIRKKEVDRAMSLVEQIVKQGQLKEAMEKCLTYCDALLDRFILLQNVKSLDDISAEAVSSLLWASQRLALEELRQVADQLTNKYGRCYAQACKKKQVATINEQLVQQISLSNPSRDDVEKMLLDITSEYKIEYIPENKNMNTTENLMDLWDAKSTTEEYDLMKDVPLISPSSFSNQNTPSSQLNIPAVGCNAPSPGGSCIATSPGGRKIWCNFDVSPVKENIENIDPLCQHTNVLQSSLTFYPEYDASRKTNPFLNDMQDDILFNTDVNAPPIIVTNPFIDRLFQDDSKTLGACEQDLFQVDSPNTESGSWKAKTVDSDLLFEMDLEDNEMMC